MFLSRRWARGTSLATPEAVNHANSPHNRSKYIRGAIAGLVATAPMTLAMEGLYRRLPPVEKNPLPPRELTMKVTEAVGVKDQLPQEDRFSLTLISHFAYGAASGLAYAAIMDQFKLGTLKGRSTSTAKGALFGLAVWAGSYLGWIPAIRLMSPAHRHPGRRTALMILVHLIWGGTTGLLSDGLTPRTVTALK